MNRRMPEFINIVQRFPFVNLSKPDFNFQELQNEKFPFGNDRMLEFIRLEHPGPLLN